jgi:hypothetical protein
MASKLGYHRDHLLPPLTGDFATVMERRRQLMTDGESSDKWASRLRLACQEDFLFFANAFGWLLEPRSTERPKLPYLTWPCQDKAFQTFIESLGNNDVMVDKSRGMGATWMVVYLFLWRCIFFEEQHFGLVSQDADLVDNRDDTDALLQKVDFAVRHLPRFLRPEVRQAKLRRAFLKTGSTMMGYAATANVMSGGRKLAILMDELAKFGLNKANADYQAMASTQHVSECRFLVSTLYMPYGAYYDEFTNPSLGVRRVVLDWKDVPYRRKGLYTATNQRLQIIDKDYRFPSDYPFILDGRTRSIWYDKEWNRANSTPEKMDREVDRRIEALGSQFFPNTTLEMVERAHQQPALARGQVTYDTDTHDVTWNPSEGGPMSLWCPLDIYGRPSCDRDYAIGADISAGTSGDLSSNSVAQIIDLTTGEQVGEYVTPSEPPTQFCNTVVALGKWFSGPGGPAVINWEIDGPTGSAFGKELNRLNWGNTFMRDAPDSHGKKKLKKPGWKNSSDNLGHLFSEMSRAMASNQLIVRSRPLLAECRQYVWMQGKIEHARSKSTDDQAARGRAHGDRVVAMGLAWLAKQDRGPAVKSEPNESQIPDYAPQGCMARRMAERDIEERETTFSESNW